MIEVPLAQLGGRQFVESPGNAQLTPLFPSQNPLHTPRSPLQAGRDATGTPLMVAQTPTLPPTLHASHCPAHALSQHTPSAQCPARHWSSAAQPAPAVPWGTQVFPEQYRPTAQSARVAQLVRHAVAPHR